MTKYILRRLLHGALSVIAVVAIVMILIYSLLNRQLVFAADDRWNKTAANQKTTYEYRKWEEYGYVDYITYEEYLDILVANGELSNERTDGAERTERERAIYNATNAAADDTVVITMTNGDKVTVKDLIDRFRAEYEDDGYTVEDLPYRNVRGGDRQVFAYRDRPLIKRLLTYFGGLIRVDNIHYVPDEAPVEAPAEGEEPSGYTGLGDRKITFTLHDPVYGGKFAPAIMGNGTQHKYLLYFDSQFPFIHQNLVDINLGLSYTVNSGVDVYQTMNETQGSKKYATVTYPTGYSESSADDLHSAKYVPDSWKNGGVTAAKRYTDNYTNVTTVKSGMSRIGYSFVIGIIATILSYVVGIPLGIIMAKRKDKLIDKLGTFYIVFISAVPSLAYIFLFKAIGNKMGLPTTFDMDSTSKLMYVLPIVSLALPSVAGLMKWIRRYMIDQMNSDYVKFARSGGLSEGEIFRKHILKNAIIPVVHGIPGSVLGALTGAIITERVYVVPGAGNLLTTAINNYDNGVIVGVTLFYAVLSVVSIILGDVLMAMVDPRISFSSKAR